MEQLQNLLKEYNQIHTDDFIGYSWAYQYVGDLFPKYWRIIYSIVLKLPRSLRVLEIGSGFGAVTSIFAYLGYVNIKGYERDVRLAKIGNTHLAELFCIENIISDINFCNQKEICDILVLVNCSFVDNCADKEEYKKQIVNYYEVTGSPRYFILEVIDSSFKEQSVEFPEYIRLNKYDICSMFPTSKILSWVTYEFPVNKKSKTLYLIETI